MDKPNDDIIDVEPVSVKLEDLNTSSTTSQKATKKNKKVLSSKEKSARDGFFADTCNETIRLILNQVTLRDSKQEISKQEMIDTQFGQSLSYSISYYFPEWNFDHPVWVMGISAMALVILINKKAPTIKEKRIAKALRDAEKEEEEDESYEQERKIIITDKKNKSASNSNNPYLSAADRNS
ncbi:MAG: hypothetical protein ABIJ18_05790 [archaeon]